MRFGLKKRLPCRFIQQLLHPQFSLILCFICAKKNVWCLIIQTKQRCTSAWVCICPGAASALASSIRSTVLDFSVFDRRKGMKKKYMFCACFQFRQISKTANQNAQRCNCIYALRSANLLKNERRFRVAATAYVRKSATQENWADLRRQVCVGLCDCWFYSGAVLRAEWISQIILWVMRSGLVAHKSTGGLKPRSPKGKTASSCFFTTVLGCIWYFLFKKL